MNNIYDWGDVLAVVGGLALTAVFLIGASRLIVWIFN